MTRGEAAHVLNEAATDVLSVQFWMEDSGADELLIDRIARVVADIRALVPYLPK